MKIAILPGDGIGPEIISQALRVLAVLRQEGMHIDIEETPVGGAAYDQYGMPYPTVTQKICGAADAILLGAVGGPQYDQLDRPLRPERGLLAIRRDLDLFANLRPAVVFPELENASTLKAEVVRGLDIMVIREQIGDVYFGQPRGMRVNETGEREAFNTMIYTESEIRRIAHFAFAVAGTRSKKKLCSVDKANVLETTEFWREIFIDVSREYPHVELSHMYVDNAAMQLVRNPGQFDVIVTGNMFGDILSDEASMLTGSIGMLATASLNESKKGLYEPGHGSAPDIAGKNIANPLAAILSVAMMFRYSFDDIKTANRIETAVKSVLAKGYRTADLFEAGTEKISCSGMGDQVLRELC
jgi:3-isopropylmalate dehydrogenase